MPNFMLLWLFGIIGSMLGVFIWRLYKGGKKK